MATTVIYGKSGGKGGSVLLITATLFVGYLYFTRRLPNVLQAISKTPMDLAKSTVSVTPGGTAPVQPGTTPGFGTVPIAPSGYPVDFWFTIGPPYNQSVHVQAANPSDCRTLVHEQVLAITRSVTLAALYENLACA